MADLSFGQALIGEQPQHATPATNVNVGHAPFQARNTETWEPDLSLNRLADRLPVPVLRVSQAGHEADPESKCLVSRVRLS
jgi:hypothetical protein